jgi:hypothetical protein
MGVLFNRLRGLGKEALIFLLGLDECFLEETGICTSC